jgi:hypothetical protein
LPVLLASQSAGAVWVAEPLNSGMLTLAASGEAAMKPTDEDDEKIASLKRKTLPTFVLAALVFMLTVTGTSALWRFMIAAMRR